METRMSRTAEQSTWCLAVGSGIPLFLGTMIIGLCVDLKCLLTGKDSGLHQHHLLTAYLFTGLVVQSAGCGARLFLVSLVSPLVSSTHRARLFTSIGLFDTIGQLVRAPLMESLFAQSMQMEGFSRGLPFYVSAVSPKIIVRA
jgi:hypothetical protein